jgi:hypothetical protein
MNIFRVFVTSVILLNWAQSHCVHQHPIVTGTAQFIVVNAGFGWRSKPYSRQSSTRCDPANDVGLCVVRPSRSIAQRGSRQLAFTTTVAPIGAIRLVNIDHPVRDRAKPGNCRNAWFHVTVSSGSPATRRTIPSHFYWPLPLGIADGYFLTPLILLSYP